MWFPEWIAASRRLWISFSWKITIRFKSRWQPGQKHVQEKIIKPASPVRPMFTVKRHMECMTIHDSTLCETFYPTLSCDKTHQMAIFVFLQVGKEGFCIYTTAISRLVAAGEGLYFVPGTVRRIRPASNWDCNEDKDIYIYVYIYYISLPTSLLACLPTYIHTYMQTICKWHWPLMASGRSTI